MTIKILLSLILGVLAGKKFNLDFSDLKFNIIDLLTYAILFFSGLSIGYSGQLKENIKKAGANIIIMPLITIFAAFIAAVFLSFVLRIDLIDSIIVNSGLGWYTFSGAVISKYDVKLGTLAFLANISREIMAVISIPIIAKKIGYLETVPTGGATSAYTCLGPISESTNSKTSLTAFLNGMSLTIFIPMIVQFFLSVKYDL